MPTVHGHRAYCYAELAAFFPSGSRINCYSTHFAYPPRDDQAELAWMAWLNTKTVYLQMVTHLSNNPARRRVTSLMCNDVISKPKNCSRNDCNDTRCWFLQNIFKFHRLLGNLCLIHWQ